MYWRRILNFLSSVRISEYTQLLFGKIIKDISLSVCGNLSKIIIVKFLEDENLIYVHQK